MKVVLVSYCDSNKKIAIPSGENDINYLTEECRKQFSFGCNVNVKLTFQKFDPDWDCFVDLDDSYVATSKDKLKLLVTPLLQDNFPTPKSSAVSVSDQRYALM